MRDTPAKKRRTMPSMCAAPSTVVHMVVCANDSPAAAEVKQSGATTCIIT